MSNVIERLESLGFSDPDEFEQEFAEVVNALPDLLKLARAAAEFREADRRFLVYPPHREAAIAAAVTKVADALEPLFREVGP